VALAALGAIAEVAIRRGRQVPRPVAFARSFGVVNLAFALGWINVLRGRRYEAWTPAGNDEARAPTGSAETAGVEVPSAPTAVQPLHADRP